MLLSLFIFNMGPYLFILLCLIYFYLFLFVCPLFFQNRRRLLHGLSDSRYVSLVKTAILRLQSLSPRAASARKNDSHPLSPGMVQTYRVVGDSPWLVLTAASRTTFFQTPKRPAYCDMYIVTCYNKNQNWAAYFYSGYPQDFFYVSGAWLGGVLTNACVLSAKHIVNTKPLYLNYLFYLHPRSSTGHNKVFLTLVFEVNKTIVWMVFHATFEQLTSRHTWSI